MKAKVTISRSSDDKVRISFEDCASGIEFAEAQLSVEAFGFAITGLAYQEADLEVRGLQWVGKTRVRENRRVECPLSSYSKKEELANWLKTNCQEDGWLLNTYLGSQSSVQTVDNKVFLNYHVTKYVDPESE